MRSRLDAIRADLATLRASGLSPRRSRFAVMRIGLQLHNLALLEPGLVLDIDRLILAHNLAEPDPMRHLVPLNCGLEAMLHLAQARSA